MLIGTVGEDASGGSGGGTHFRHIRLRYMRTFAGNALAFDTLPTNEAGKLDNRLPLKNGSWDFGIWREWNEKQRFSQVSFARRADAIRLGNDL